MPLVFRKFVFALIMVVLPLQGALAAIMPLCAQAGQALHLSAGAGAAVHAAKLPCSQHDASDDFLASQAGGDQESFNLPCDGAVCHISGGGLPSTTASLNLAGGFSFTPPFKSSFTSSTLPQPQRPPLA